MFNICLILSITSIIEINLLTPGTKAKFNKPYSLIIPSIIKTIQEGLIYLSDNVIRYVFLFCLKEPNLKKISTVNSVGKMLKIYNQLKTVTLTR
jgi:hypothetical protein